jgi:hypothetical protein
VSIKRKAEYYETTNVMNTLEHLQQLVGLLSTVSMPYRDVMIDLFPSHLVGGMIHVRKDEDHLWYSAIYAKQFPSLEIQQQEAQEKAEERRVKEAQENAEEHRATRDPVTKKEKPKRFHSLPLESPDLGGY